MEKSYAAALWSLVKKGKDPKDAVRDLHAVLEKRGHRALMHRISRAFESLVRHSEQHATLTLSVAREKDVHAAQRAIAQYLVEMKAEAHEVTTRVDETLIGGWRLEGRGRLIDASYKQGLVTLYERITKA